MDSPTSEALRPLRAETAYAQPGAAQQPEWIQGERPAWAPHGDREMGIRTVFTSTVRAPGLRGCGSRMRSGETQSAGRLPA